MMTNIFKEYVWEYFNGKKYATRARDLKIVCTMNIAEIA